MLLILVHQRRNLHEVRTSTDNVDDLHRALPQSSMWSSTVPHAIRPRQHNAGR
jgi:hypothetical protein